MNCKEVEEREILERYLLDRLTEPEREEFEKHYFECGTCFFQLQTGLALQTELRRQPAMPARARRASWRRGWVWAPAFATIVILFSAGIWWYSGRNRQPSQQVASPPSKVNPNVPVQVQSPSAPSLEELGRVEPPPYSGMVLRGAEDEAHETFQQAMQLYVKRDYTHAIPGVRAAVEAGRLLFAGWPNRPGHRILPPDCLSGRPCILRVSTLLFGESIFTKKRSTPCEE
jgi:hypothetical protein